MGKPLAAPETGQAGPAWRWTLAVLVAVTLLLPAARSGAAEADAPFVFRGDVRIPMQDGIELSANLYLPPGDGPFPVVLLRTPYGKPGRDWGDPKQYAPAGFAMVVQDCRGRGQSQGVWDPFRYDPQDGFDTQEWIGRQPWCNGRIGTAGGSYGGWTQWASAPYASRYLKAMVPVVPFSETYRDIAYPGGAFQLSLLFGWGAAVGGIPIDPAKLGENFKYLPLNRWDEQFPKQAFFLRDWVAHPAYDDYWRDRGIDGRYAQVAAPSLNIGGWYDIFSKATLDMIGKVRRESTNRLARRNQFVIMGPWAHGVGARKVGAVDFGEDATLKVGDLQFQWFQYWLRDQESGVDQWAPLRLFVMGENRWRDENEWPLARTKFTAYYLHSEGHANTRSGNGTLSVAAPDGQPPDVFTYNPEDPAPTTGGNNLVGTPAGSFDQAAVEERLDVLVYSTGPLEQPVEVTGPVRVILHAATSARDTDFTAKLVDVHPDGKAYNLCDGIIRARYRESIARATPIEPGKPLSYDIDLWVTSNLFKKGHRIRLEISSSNFPRFDRNPNSGLPFGTDTRLLPARQTVYHDTTRPSHLLLPVIPR